MFRFFLISFFFIFISNSNAEIKKRLGSWKRPRNKTIPGVLSKYAKLVSQADKGAITVD